MLCERWSWWVRKDVKVIIFLGTVYFRSFYSMESMGPTLFQTGWVANFGICIPKIRSGASHSSTKMPWISDLHLMPWPWLMKIIFPVRWPEKYGLNPGLFILDKTAERRWTTPRWTSQNSCYQLKKEQSWKLRKWQQLVELVAFVVSPS